MVVCQNPPKRFGWWYKTRINPKSSEKHIPSATMKRRAPQLSDGEDVTQSQ